jgi:hypothetical protein|tara:strand:- start:22 stop:321 length:300 start_codon:yes stop_codon:yes gene_type:complete
MKEQINPDYYKNKKIETYEAIVSQLSPLEVIGALKWQIMKYMMRFGEKHGGDIDASLTDTSKAHWYMEKLIQYLNDLKKSGGVIEKADNVSELFKEKNK